MSLTGDFRRAAGQVVAAITPPGAAMPQTWEDARLIVRQSLEAAYLAGRAAALLGVEPVGVVGLVDDRGAGEPVVLASPEGRVVT